MRKPRTKLYKGYKFTSKWGRVWEIVGSDKGNHTLYADGVYLVRDAKEIVNCQVLHPLDVTVKGLGFVGVGPHTLYENPHRAGCWRSMFKRCYSNDPHYSTYKEIDICEEWLNFQNFAEWYNANYINGYDLDKDLKDIKGKGVYSPETCCFLPPNLNKKLSHSYGKVPTKEGRKFRAKMSFNGKYYELGRYSCWVNAICVQIITRFSVLEGEIRDLFGDAFVSCYWNNVRLNDLIVKGVHNARSTI